MELIVVLVYFYLKYLTGLIYEYKRAKIKEPPPPVQTTAIGFDTTPTVYYDEDDD